MVVEEGSLSRIRSTKLQNRLQSGGGIRRCLSSSDERFKFKYNSEPLAGSSSTANLGPPMWGMAALIHH